MFEQFFKNKWTKIFERGVAGPVRILSNTIYTADIKHSSHTPLVKKEENIDLKGVSHTYK